MKEISIPKSFIKRQNVEDKKMQESTTTTPIENNFKKLANKNEVLSSSNDHNEFQGRKIMNKKQINFKSNENSQKSQLQYPLVQRLKDKIEKKNRNQYTLDTKTQVIDNQPNPKQKYSNQKSLTISKTNKQEQSTKKNQSKKLVTPIKKTQKSVTSRQRPQSCHMKKNEQPKIEAENTDVKKIQQIQSSNQKIKTLKTKLSQKTLEMNKQPKKQCQTIYQGKNNVELLKQKYSTLQNYHKEIAKQVNNFASNPQLNDQRNKIEKDQNSKMKKKPIKTMTYQNSKKSLVTQRSPDKNVNLMKTTHQRSNSERKLISKPKKQVENTQQKFNQQQEMKDHEFKFFENNEELLKYIAATKIQALWRGFSMRKLIVQFFEQFAHENKQIDENEHSLCIFDEEISAINKAEVSIQNKSRELQKSQSSKSNHSDEKMNKWNQIKQQIYQLQTSYDCETSELVRNLERRFFQKKNNLCIDTSKINQEYQENYDKKEISQSQNYEASESKQDINITKMRQFLGSEELVRKSWELQDKFVESKASLNIKSDRSQSKENLYNLCSPNTQNLFNFQCQPFQEFVKKKFEEMMIKENMDKLIIHRKQALDLRHKTEAKNINQLFEKNQFTPNTYMAKKLELEKWVQNEEKELQITRKVFDENWQLTNKTLLKTNRDIQFMNTIIEKNRLSLTNINTTNSQEIDQNKMSSYTQDYQKISQSSLQQEQNHLQIIEEKQTDYTPIKVEEQIIVQQKSDEPSQQLLECEASCSSQQQSIYKIEIDDEDSLYQENYNKVFTLQQLEKLEKRSQKIESIENRVEELIMEHIFDRIQIIHNEKCDKIKKLEYEQQQVRQISQNEQKNQSNSQVEEIIQVQQKTLKQNTEDEYGQEEFEEITKTEQNFLSSDYITDVRVSKESEIQTLIRTGQKCKFIADYTPQKSDRDEQSPRFSNNDSKPQYSEQDNCLASQSQYNITCELSTIKRNEQLKVPDDILHSNQSNKSETVKNLKNVQEFVVEAMPQSILDINQEKTQQTQQNQIFQQKKQCYSPQNQANQKQVEQKFIDTSIEYTKNYLLLIKKQILINKIEVLQMLNSHAGFSSLEQLRLIQHNLQMLGKEQAGIDDFVISKEKCIHVSVYEKVQKQMQFTGPILTSKLQFNLQAQYNRLLFDSFEEVLNNHRAIHTNRLILDWKPKTHSKKQVTIEKLDQIIDNSIELVLISHDFLCGFLNENCSPYDDNYVISIREEKMAFLLAQQILEYEEKWIQYELEEAEVANQLAELIIEEQIHQFTLELQNRAQIDDQKKEN